MENNKREKEMNEYFLRIAFSDGKKSYYRFQAPSDLAARLCADDRLISEGLEKEEGINMKLDLYKKISYE